MEIWAKKFESISPIPPTREKLTKFKDNLNGSNFLRKKYSIPKYIKKKLKKSEISINEHALERWNIRVGPKTNCSELSELIKQLIRLNRVNFVGDDYGYIDNDILFVYEWTSNKEITIITFYGRVSKNICLQSFPTLRKYNRNNLEQLNLDLSEEELKVQTMPFIPYKVVRYFKDWKRFELSFYETEKEDVVIYIEQGEGMNLVQFVNDDDMTSILIEFPEIKTYLEQ